MKDMNESERILAIFGGLLTCAALVLSLTTEIMARRHLAEYRRLVAAGAPVIQQGAVRGTVYDKHIGFEVQTLQSRWSIPDGHASLGAAFAIFGMILVAVPRSTAGRRAAGQRVTAERSASGARSRP
jgi:membrane-associated phospholipid phosphatase